MHIDYALTTYFYRGYLIWFYYSRKEFFCPEGALGQKLSEIQVKNGCGLVKNSPERHIQHHHHKKARHHAERARMRVLAEVRLRNQLLDHDIQHRACGC